MCKALPNTWCKVPPPFLRTLLTVCGGQELPTYVQQRQWYGYFGVVLWVVGLNSWVHHRERPDPGVLESVESGRRCLWWVAIVPHHARGAKVVKRSVGRPNYEGQIGHTIRSRCERVELLFVASGAVPGMGR